MRRYAVFFLGCCVLAGGDALAQSEVEDDSFAYTNEEGEEIFGPDYMPSSSVDPGLPYWVGRPNAGFQIPEGLLTLPQAGFVPDFMIESAPAEGAGRRTLPVMPLRKDFDRPRELQEFIPVDRFNSLPQRSETRQGDARPSRMWAHFVNVGQGDGAVLEFPCQVAVIDVGGEFGGGPGKVDGGRLFREYLESFFAERPHLNNTIDVVFLTHPHADHINGLPRLIDEDGNGPFTIRNVVDNGQTGNTGRLKKQSEFRERAIAMGAGYSAVELARQVTATGITNAAIDPVICPDIDPIITAFWGGVNEAIQEFEEYRNPNNHSVIVRVDFGAASFLFTGDLEDKGEADLREQYESNIGVFDVDVYQVSHHGADDDTSDRLMEIMTPRIAVISMGDPETRGIGSAWGHGHPRIGTIEVLQDEPGIVSDLRDPPEQVLAAQAHKTDFELIEVRKAIYGTAWDGTVIIEATSDGDYSIGASSPD